MSPSISVTYNIDQSAAAVLYVIENCGCGENDVDNASIESLFARDVGDLICAKVGAATSQLEGLEAAELSIWGEQFAEQIKGSIQKMFRITSLCVTNGGVSEAVSIGHAKRAAEVANIAGQAAADNAAKKHKALSASATPISVAAMAAEAQVGFTQRVMIADPAGALLGAPPRQLDNQHSNDGDKQK